MCGIAGIISANPFNVSKQRLQIMTDTIQHRGPEGDGFWFNETGNVGLGHRRLSIIDLSTAASQPMHYMGRYSITYNGEIYNYVELKTTLENKGYSFTSHCDTEVVLAAYACYGKQCLQYFDGMFAFALWDDQTQTLFCARDRFGEKPFYYYYDDEHFLFASEMKALWAIGVEKKMRQSILLNYLTLGFTTNPTNQFETFYDGVNSLPAGNFLELTITNSSTAGNHKINVESYWDLDKETEIRINEEQATEQFLHLLQTSIKRRLRSDVAIGTSLSGGLDSSSIAAIIHPILQTANQYSQASFSAVFPGFINDESSKVKLVADKYNLKSFTITPTADDLISDFEKLVYHQEEPFQSASIYAQYKVYELAKQHNVTVLLDGQGADETIAGYHRYYHWYWQELIAKGKRKHASSEIAKARSIGVKDAWSIANYFAAFMPALTARQLEKKAKKQLQNHPYINYDFFDAERDNTQYKPVVDKLNDILYFNTKQLGLQELLRYADRNSMAHSREVRLPFLSHELVEFIFSLPSSFKIRQGWSKWILRNSTKNILPADIVWRKDKVGFEPPQQQWMQHKQMQEYLHESRKSLVTNGILKSSILSKPLIPQSAHEAGNYDWRYLCVSKCLQG